MPFTLQQFTIGDTNYVSKHNANAIATAAAVDALQTTVTNAATAGINTQSVLLALFGGSQSVIGEDSYALSTASAILTVNAGYLWSPMEQTVLYKAAATNIDFTGFAADTYYLHIGATGEPSVDTVASLGVYSIVWGGSSFGVITRLAPVAWGYSTFDAAKTSAALGGQVYQELDDRLEASEGATVGVLVKTVAAANITLTDPEAMENAVIILSGAQSANIDLIVPDYEKPYTIINSCTGGYTVTIKTSGGTGVALANSEGAVVVCDATNVLLVVKNSAAAVDPYDVGGTYNGAPAASAVLIRYPVPRTVTLPSGLTGSQGVAGTAATAQTDFDIKKNGSSVGTMRFAAAGTTATFIMASETVFSAGDVLTVAAPASPDATCADLGFALKGTR